VVVPTTRATLHYNETNRAGLFYAESWLMAHYALFSGQYQRGGGLDLFLKLLNGGGDPDNAFRQSFGAYYGVMQNRLKNYVVNGKYNVAPITLPAAVPAEAFVRYQPSAAEVEFALGGLLVVTRGPAAALPHLLAAAREAPADPRPWEQLGSGPDRLPQVADRPRASGFQRLRDAQHLADAGDPAQAKTLLRGLASDATMVSDVRGQARQLLYKIEAGVPAAPSPSPPGP